MKPKELPSAERLRELFDYDPLRGELVWRESRGGTARAGSVAGKVTKQGYRHIRVEGELYYAHRLIWKYCYTTEPSGQLDHIGQERLSIKQNHIWNLRDLTTREHITVTQAHYKDSSLPVGVYLKGERYYSIIGQDGKYIYLGTYDTPQEAHQAYLQALQIIESGGVVVSAARPTSSRFKGVSWHKGAQKWTAQWIHPVSKKKIHLGCFSTEIEAHYAVCGKSVGVRKLSVSHCDNL
ncbi:AP2 domain-containing protein [Synechococcus sp. AH-229-G18]|nr:AP2 domain-containing protein [Synechococcus sp. AH-229-G18]